MKLGNLVCYHTDENLRCGDPYQTQSLLLNLPFYSWAHVKIAVNVLQQECSMVVKIGADTYTSAAKGLSIILPQDHLSFGYQDTD